MTQVTKYPDTAITNTSSPSGGTFPEVLGDSDDGTYLDVSNGESFSVGFEDLSLPAGAVVRFAASVIRISRPNNNTIVVANMIAGDAESDWGQTITWGAIQSVYGPSLGQGAGVTTAELTDADVDGLTMAFANWGPAKAYVYEFYIIVQYWIQPTANVDDQGPFTDDDTPTLAFNGTFDDNVSGEYYFESKIFTEAQAVAMGFDPDTSTPVDESGSQIVVRTDGTPGTGAISGEWTTNIPLDNDDYRVYTRVADVPWPNSLQWSDWDHGTFTIDVDRPDPPILTVTPDSARGRIHLHMQQSFTGPASTDLMEVERSLDDGATWEDIRTLRGEGFVDMGIQDPPPGDVYHADQAQAWDYEVPNGTTAMYRARAIHEYPSGTYGRSDWDTGSGAWISNDWWFKHPYDSSKNFKPRIRSQPDRTEAAKQSHKNILGRQFPVVIGDVRSGWAGDIAVRSDTDAERLKLDVLLEDDVPILIQAPPSSYNWDDTWCSCSDLVQNRAVDTDITPWTFDQFAWTEVDRPTGNMIEWEEVDAAAGDEDTILI